MEGVARPWNLYLKKFKIYLAAIDVLDGRFTEEEVHVVAMG